MGLLGLTILLIVASALGPVAAAACVLLGVPLLLTFCVYVFNALTRPLVLADAEEVHFRTAGVPRTVAVGDITEVVASPSLALVLSTGETVEVDGIAVDNYEAAGLDWGETTPQRAARLLQGHLAGLDPAAPPSVRDPGIPASRKAAGRAAVWGAVGMACVLALHELIR
jgi:uncharacterized protein (DUF58 family)